MRGEDGGSCCAAGLGEPRERGLRHRGHSAPSPNPIVNAELQHFVREALARGIPRAEIRAQLGGAGWRPEEVDAALGAWAEASFAIPVPRRHPSLSAREAFLYLVMFSTLYVAAFNAGRVLFGVIERRF